MPLQLLGEFKHSVDTKNRMFIPAKFREQLGDSFVIFRSVRDRYIKLLSNEEWEKYTAPIKELPRKDAERAMRLLTQDASSVTPDAQGRIIIPQALLDHAGIVKDAVVVGCGPYIEIWAKEEYDKTMEDIDLDAVIKELEELGL